MDDDTYDSGHLIANDTIDINFPHFFTVKEKPTKLNNPHSESNLSSCLRGSNATPISD